MPVVFRPRGPVFAPATMGPESSPLLAQPGVDLSSLLVVPEQTVTLRGSPRPDQPGVDVTGSGAGGTSQSVDVDGSPDVVQPGVTPLLGVAPSTPTTLDVAGSPLVTQPGADYSVGAAPPPPSGTVNPPSSIAYDGVTDVTTAMAAWLASLPNSSTIDFLGRPYLMQRECKVTAKDGWTVRNVNHLRTAAEPYPKPAGYTGAHMWFLQCNDLTVETYRIRGTNTVSDLTSDPSHPKFAYGSYVADWELAAGIRVERSDGFYIVDWDIDGVWGDFVQMSRVNNFEVDTGVGDRNGRQGITPLGIVGSAHDFQILHSRRGGLDFEPFNATPMCGDIEVYNFEITTNLSAFPSQGRGSVNNILIRDGHVYGNAVPMSKIAASDAARRSNWRFHRVEQHYTASSPSQSPIVADYVDGLEILDCILPVRSTSPTLRSVAMKSCGGTATILGNDFGSGLYVINDTPMPGQVLDIAGNTPTQTVI